MVPLRWRVHTPPTRGEPDARSSCVTSTQATASGLLLLDSRSQRCT
jgi:hypothetical protein